MTLLMCFVYSFSIFLLAASESSNLTVITNINKHLQALIELINVNLNKTHRIPTTKRPESVAGTSKKTLTSIESKASTSCIVVKYPSLVISIVGCLKRAISLNACVGACYSSDKQIVNNRDKVVTVCNCCQPIEFQDISEEFTCINADGMIVTSTMLIKEPTRCICKKC